VGHRNQVCVSLLGVRGTTHCDNLRTPLTKLDPFEDREASAWVFSKIVAVTIK